MTDSLEKDRMGDDPDDVWETGAELELRTLKARICREMADWLEKEKAKNWLHVGSNEINAKLREICELTEEQQEHGSKL